MQIDALEKERRVLEEGMRYGAESGLRDDVTQHYEEEALRLRRNWYFTLALLLIGVFAIFLPFWFVNFEGLKAHGDGHTATPVKVGEVIKTIDAAAHAPMQMPTDESLPHTH